LLQTFGAGEMQDYLITFVNSLDPNVGSTHPNWPKWTSGSPNLMTFLDGLIPLTITKDTYRQSAMNLLTQLSLTAPL
jgi:hypothetical protein